MDQIKTYLCSLKLTVSEDFGSSTFTEKLPGRGTMIPLQTFLSISVGPPLFHY